jgi:hypothetical protein
MDSCHRITRRDAPAPCQVPQYRRAGDSRHVATLDAAPATHRAIQSKSRVRCLRASSVIPASAAPSSLGVRCSDASALAHQASPAGGGLL